MRPPWSHGRPGTLKPPVSARITFVLFVLLAAAGPTRHSAAQSADLAGAGRFVVRFEDHFGAGGLRLPGPTASRTIPLGLDARWRPRSGSELHLFVAHSPGLDPQRSFLTVTFNGGILRSLRLDATNERPTEVVIPIPPEMIQRRNELHLGVRQAEQADHDAPWALIGARSFVSFLYDEAKSQASLGDLPLPLLDPLGPRPLRLGIVVPSRLTLATLEATALAIANLSSRLAPRAVELRLMGGLDGPDPLLVVGTPAEQDLLEEAASGPIAVEASDDGPRVTVRDRSSMEPSTGVLALVGRERGRPPLLAVTGNSPEAVQRAGWALAGFVGLQGDLVLVSELPDWVPAPARRWRGFAPPRARFSLSDLGYGPVPKLDADAPIRMAIRVLPDTRFLAYGHRLRISLRRLPALLEQGNGAVEVAWNEAPVRTFAAAELPSKPQFALEVPLAAEALRTENVLQLAWKPGAGSIGPVLEIDPDGTELYLPREHEARLPDLSLLRHSLFPLGLRADLSDVVLVVPDRLNEETFALVCELSAFLGRILPTDRIGLRVRQPSTLAPAERSSAHLIVLRTSRGPDPFAQSLPDPAKASEDTGVTSLPVLQQAVSPWNREKYLLSLRASSAAALLRAFRTLSQPQFLADLKGDTAFLSPRGPLCHTLGTQRVVRETSYLTRAEAYLRSHWLALPAVLALISGLMFLALRLALEHRRGALRHPTELGRGAR